MSVSSIHFCFKGLIKNLILLNRMIFFKALLPNKTTNLSVTNVKSRSVEIRWKGPQNEGDGGLERFLIKLTKDNSLIWSKTTGIQDTYTLYNLSPGTTYEISVAAGNKHGFGDKTIISFTTLEEGKTLTDMQLCRI